MTNPAAMSIPSTQFVVWKYRFSLKVTRTFGNGSFKAKKMCHVSQKYFAITESKKPISDYQGHDKRT